MYVTNCSASKAQWAEEPLPPGEMYLTPRISWVMQKASEAHEEVSILSGEHGLVPATQGITYYDHLLSKDEVGPLVEKVAKQIKERGITNIDFWAIEKEAKDPMRATARYIEVVFKACR